MRIVYLTTDKRNTDSAARMAHECGASLISLPDGVTLPSGSFEAVLHDLDHLDAEQKQTVIADLLSGSPSHPSAVHGYSLEQRQAGMLDARGVIVSPYLGLEVVRRLCRAVQSHPPSLASEVGVVQGEQQSDPTRLCAAVRALASHAYRTTRSLDGNGGDRSLVCEDLIQEIADVQWQIDWLRQYHKLPLAELQRWLDRLREQVVEHPLIPISRDGVQQTTT
ncbi:MAG TPA: hypothetical protein VGZ22_07015, partial [Isosphaeraceae bacterium]|nr:hypothetical protein [Isosphaeraceae bacterium]